MSSKASVGLGTLEGCGDGEFESMLVVGSLDGVELGSPLTKEEGNALGACDSRRVRFNEGVDDGSLLGEALLLPSEEGRELGMTDGSDDGVSDTILDGGSIDGKELGLSQKEEVGDTLGTCDSPIVGFNDGAEDGSLLGEALLLPSEDGRELGKFDGSTDGESETIFDEGSFEVTELGFPLTDDKGDALGSCESPAVRFKDGVEEGPLLGDALSSKASVGLGTLEGCGDGESDSLDGVELGPPLTEEEGNTLGACDSRGVGFNEFSTSKYRIEVDVATKAARGHSTTNSG